MSSSYPDSILVVALKDHDGDALILKKVDVSYRYDDKYLYPWDIRKGNGNKKMKIKIVKKR